MNGVYGTDIQLTGAVASARDGSDHVVLRHPRAGDFDAWAALREVSRDALSAWEPDWAENHFDRRAFRQRLSVYRRLVGAGTAHPFHIFTPDGTLIGAVNLSDIRRHIARSAQVGYWIGTPHTRRGYGQAAVGAVVRFAFHQLGLHRLEAAVQPDNVGSVRLLENARFQPEGLARGYLRVDGEWRDHRIYARLTSD